MPSVTAATFTIDRTGEMPSGALSPPAVPLPPSRTPTPSYAANGSRAGTPVPALATSRFPAYDVADADADVPRAGGTPEPIKVTRAKKKGASGAGTKENGKGKKKRSKPAEAVGQA